MNGRGSSRMVATLLLWLLAGSLMTGVAVAQTPASAFTPADHTEVVQAIAASHKSIVHNLNGAGTVQNILRTALKDPGVSPHTKSLISSQLLPQASRIPRLAQLSPKVIAEMARIKAALPLGGNADPDRVATALGRLVGEERQRGFPQLADALEFSENMVRSGAGTIYSDAYYRRIAQAPSGFRLASYVPAPSVTASVGSILGADVDGAELGSGVGGMFGPKGALIGAGVGAGAKSLLEILSEIVDMVNAGPSAPSGPVSITKATLTASASKTKIDVPVLLSVNYSFAYSAEEISCVTSWTFQFTQPALENTIMTLVHQTNPTHNQTVTGSGQGSEEAAWGQPTEVAATGHVTCGSATVDTNVAHITVTH